MYRRWKNLSPIRKIHIQLWTLFVCILCLMLTVTLFARQQTVPQGVTIGEWKAGRMPVAEFQALFSGTVEALARQPVVIHTPADQRPLQTTFGELGLKTNADEIIGAIRGVTEGSLLNRANRRWFMRNEAFRLVLMLDEERLERTVNAHWKQLQSAMPVDARRIIDENDHVRLVPDIPAYRIDMVELLSELDRQLYTEFYATIDRKLLDSPGNRPANSREKDDSPKPQAETGARDDTFIALPAGMDESATPREATAGEPLYVELPLRILPAKITVQDLESQQIKRKIMEFSTTLYPGSGGRRYNIDSTAKVLNDTILAPGEVFDYAKIIEQTRQRFGFRQAPVIMDGVLVPGIGGGICQVSTTLYNAVIRAGLEIVERRNHSLPISYAPLGQDATFSTGYINFRFRNTLESHLLIRAELKGNQVIVKLFGDMDPGISYTIESKIVKEVAPPVKYVHNPGLQAGVEKTLSKGKKGYVVDTFRTRYVNGVKKETERLSRDFYQPQPVIVARNQGSGGQSQRGERDDKRKPMIEDGVFGPVFD